MAARFYLFIVLLSLTAACGGDGAPSTCRDDQSCPIGEPCSRHDDCASGLCDGVCLQPCADEQECGEALGCRVRQLAEPVAVCTPVERVVGDLGDPCNDASQCRGGVCHEGRCSELCTTCIRGARCTPAQVDGLDAAVCEWVLATPVVTVGPFDVSQTGSDEIPIEIPDGLASFSIVVRDENPGTERRVGISMLRAPDGTVLDNGDLDYSDPNRAAIRYPDASTITVPIADLGAVAPGTYTVAARLWDVDLEAADPWVPATGRVSVDVVFEWEGEPGGLLDLNLFVTPAAGIPPRTEDAFLSAMLDVVETQFGGAGIALGEVTASSLPADFDSVGSSEQVRTICREHSSGGRFGTALNVFLVDTLEFALGFTGGTPSPPGLYGAAPSGIVVDIGNDPGQTGIVVAHELGHFLGLFHTTAFNNDGTVFATDPVSDTPECSGESTSCPDRANLMFPTIDFGQEHALTSGQLDVLARNPLLYELVRTDRCEQWPARDVTITQRAAGLLPAAGTTSGSCGGAAGEVAHLLRVGEPASMTLRSRSDAAIYVRDGDCATGEELACAVGELTVDLQAGDYFVFVDGDEGGGAYHLDVER